MKGARIVAVCGFASNVGKTTLMCELLRACPGSEAIKITRGHYRSCGKDPHSCCVSDLLSDIAIIHSGRVETYELSKDTGRYWNAGAANVHWVIVKDSQVERGVTEALGRVEAPMVFVEGTGFLDFVIADFVIMVSRADPTTVKSSARRALRHSTAIYLSGAIDENDGRRRFADWAKRSGMNSFIDGIPVYTEEDLPELIASVQENKLTGSSTITVF
jgi:molybdopterin-guanine dinucleotide biosynthesis protein